MSSRRTKPIVMALLAVLALVASGCSHTTRTPTVVIDAIPGAPSAEVFERLVQSARTQGYAPEGADVALGIFRVPAKWTARGAHHFDVQCFASGHVQIVPTGPTVRRECSDSLMPSELRDELVAFAAGLATIRETR